MERRRSHMMTLYSAKISSNNQEDDVLESVLSPLVSSSSSSGEAKGLLSNGEKGTFSVDKDCIFTGWESEAESSKENPFCIRSKRVGKNSKLFYSDNNNEFLHVKKSKEPLSSVSDVAYCLMMLSRDKWSCNKEGDFSQDSWDFKLKKTCVVRGKFKCETCRKFFRSYQALGGHRANHKKMPAAAEKIHKCPFCDRVFISGQALGGHKRSHLIGAANNVARICGSFDIDLNLPAPSDVDDDEN